jgi:hypothetical protein
MAFSINARWTWNWWNCEVQLKQLTSSKFNNILCGWLNKAFTFKVYEAPNGTPIFLSNNKCLAFKTSTIHHHHHIRNFINSMIHITLFLLSYILKNVGEFGQM